MRFDVSRRFGLKDPMMVAILLAVFLGCFGLLRFGYGSYQKIVYPYMTNLGEPPLAQAIQILHRGGTPYRKLDSPPYTLVPYGPFYIG